MCQIFSQSVQGLRSSDAPKFPFRIDLLRRPYKLQHRTECTIFFIMTMFDLKSLANLSPLPFFNLKCQYCAGVVATNFIFEIFAFYFENKNIRILIAFYT